MILDDVRTDVSAQLNDQSKPGVQVTARSDVPEKGPANRGLWFQIPQVTAVFADLKSSTELNATDGPRDAAYAYTYFIRAMTLILERFSAKYIDIQGDGIFGLFSGRGSIFQAAACGVTMRTLVEEEVAVRFDSDTSSSWKLTAGIGIDSGTLLVRRLGLRGAKENEVWAGKPVNMAAKLSALADYNQIAVSERVFAQYEKASQVRQRALIWSCGCDGRTEGEGWDAPLGATALLWKKQQVPEGRGLDFEYMYKLSSRWCAIHGPEFCEAIVAG